MRRILLVGLLMTGACLNGTAPSPVASLVVNNNAPGTGVFAGDQVQLNTEALDINGDPIPVAVTYTSNNTNVATVSTSGLITVLSAGTVTITISADGQNASINLTVDGNISGSVQVLPTQLTVAPGAQQTLGAIVTTTLNHPARNKSVTWSTSDATKATVDQAGNVRGVAVTSGVSVCAAAADAPTIKGCATVIVQ
jgi:uncharacterized protein YjdB